MGGGFNFIPILTIILMFAVLYFIMIRPANKQRKQYQEMIQSLKEGDEVILRSGLHGVVSELNANTITVDAAGVYLVFERGAVLKVVSSARPEMTAVSEDKQAAYDQMTDASDDEETGTDDSDKE